MLPKRPAVLNVPILVLLLLHEACFCVGISVYDWPDVLGTTWMFDLGSTFGFKAGPSPGTPQSGSTLQGPAPDWALGGRETPTMAFDAVMSADADALLQPKTALFRSNATVMKSSSYPGSIVLEGVAIDSPAARLDISAQLVFTSSNTSLVRLKLKNSGDLSVRASFRILGSASNTSVIQDALMVKFGLHPAGHSTPCLPQVAFAEGSLELAAWVTDSRGAPIQQPLSWSLRSSGESFEATSEAIEVEPNQEAVTFAAITFARGDEALNSLRSAENAEDEFEASVRRWNGYLSAILTTKVDGDVDMRWAAVKSVLTLIHNWRLVPGLPDGVLPSYTGYEGGMWSWDTYKQAAGMAAFAPWLAKQQLRLMAAAQDTSTGHIPDKVDRCGRGGGCSGKPPLLSWAVWEVYRQTADLDFLREMYPVIERFHSFWYVHRDVRGVGLCSWTEGMESGMDDGVRFMPQFARTVANSSSHVSTLDFWSVDLNSYLYHEKNVLASMAGQLGLPAASQRWARAAEELLPRLQDAFFVAGSQGRGFFQDVYFNGSALPIQGSEGYAALFTGVATLPQALAFAETLSDPDKFLLNFSLPTVSKQNRYYNAKGYWKGPTWLDQTWFAYAGLKRYVGLARQQGEVKAATKLQKLSAELKRRVFRVGKGFAANDTTPLNEHYDAETGEPLGATHFGWTAAHTLMWAMEEAGGNDADADTYSQVYI
eukprot:TRINITY_DN76786_c0_g1_i1.p1 TRINITY_DN76786_c0_g1~~TRINITY_DN76786_c0_g1_i1.p1  ORF type:complete len:722 (+),score=150.56 TRINITY_DN76786_c0_g1_i1:36-2168(+)